MANLPEALSPGYAELCVTSNFTFLTGASHPEELVLRAADLGLQAIAITDRNSLAGVVRAHVALRELQRRLEEQAAAPDAAPAPEKTQDKPGEAPLHPMTGRPHPPVRSHRRIDPSSRQDMGKQDMQAPEAGERRNPAGLALPKLIIGSRLVLEDCPLECVALPVDKAAYARLSRLLTLGKRRAVKGACTLYLADLMEWGRGLILIALPPDLLTARPDTAQEVKIVLNRLAQHFPGHVYTGAAPGYDGQDQIRFDALYRLSLATAAPLVAVGDVLMHRAGRRALADVLTCLREGCTIATLGRRALPNAERRLKDGAGMARLFARYPAALRRTLDISARCAFSLDDLSYQYPGEVTGGEDAQDRLERLVRAGLESRERFPDGPDADTLAKVEKELALIRLKAYAPYFLTVHDIVQFARGRNILCQGRGSAANSIVCYALGITEVKPGTTLMVFERFISAERGEPPDIDVDFEHERREEVIQHIYADIPQVALRLT